MSPYEQLFPCGLSLVPDRPLDELRRLLPAHGAVYLLTDERGRAIQLAGTQNLRHAVVVRLRGATPESRRRPDFKAVTATIWWKPTYSQFETSYEFHLISRRIRPDDYLKLCAFGPAWFVRVDPEERLPQLAPTCRIGGEGGEVIGPFPDRGTCVKFVEQLVDLFDLCRYHHILERAPHGTACAYYEMGRCQAPCDGSMSLSAYRRLVRESLEVVSGDAGGVIAGWRRRMEEAATAMRYEEAATFKRRIEQAGGLLQKSCRFVRDAREFRYLVVQRHAGRKRVRPFFATREGISRGDAVPLKAVGELAERWLAELREARQGATAVDWELASEQAWLLSHFLFKREHAPGLVRHLTEIDGPAELASLLQSTFARPEPRPP